MKARGPKLYKDLKRGRSGEIRDVDFKYMYQKPDGDIGFSVEHNRRVIAETIKKNKENEKRLKKEYLENVEERIDASTYFLKALANSKYASSDPHTQALKYFGRRELARLRGEQIKQELMSKFAMASKLLNN